MGYSLGMGGFERAADLTQQQTGTFHAQRTIVAQYFAERLAQNQVHDHEGAALWCHPEIDDIDRVWMVNAARRSRLLLKAPNDLLISSQLGVQDLHGDRFIHQDMFCSIDKTH